MFRLTTSLGALLALLLLVPAAAQARFPFQGGTANGSTPPPPGCIMGTAPPAAAAGLGMNCLVFADGPFSPSRIDTTNSYAPGFQWYPGTYPSDPPYSDPEIYGQDFHIDGNGYLVAKPTVGHGQLNWRTVMTVGPHLPYTTPIANYVGTTFSGGYFIKVIASWPEGVGGGEATWPILLLWDVNFQVQYNNPTVNATTVENDFLEPLFNGPNWNVWTLVNGLYGSPCAPCGYTIGGATTSGDEYDFALLPASLNGGVAGSKYYHNGVFYSNGPANVNGHQDLMLTQHAFLAIGGQSNASMVIHRIEIWCVDISCMTTSTGNNAPPSVAQYNAVYETTPNCDTTISFSCQVFSGTTTAGNLVYIAAQEYSPVNTNDYTINCNGTPATLLKSEVHSGDISGWLFSCPAPSGALVITADKEGMINTMFELAEVHSPSGVPTTDPGTSASGYGAATNVASATLGSPTTSANDMLLSFSARGGGTVTAAAYGGGSGGPWHGLGSGPAYLAADQTPGTAGSFANNVTLTGGTGGTVITTVAVHP